MSSNSSAKKSEKVRKGDATDASTPENVTPTATSTVVTDCDVPCTIPFDQITQPGAYVCNWSGHLLRVPEDGVTPGRSPMLNMVGTQSLYVTKISADPFVSITKARLLASNGDVMVNF